MPPIPPIPLLELAPPEPPIPLELPLLLMPLLELEVLIPPLELAPPSPPVLLEPPLPPAPWGLSGPQPGVAAARSNAMWVKPRYLRFDMKEPPARQGNGNGAPLQGNLAERCGN